MSATHNYSDLTLSRPVTLAQSLVWVDGPARSGKTTLCRLLGSLNNVELERIEEIIDYVGFLYSFGKIEHDAAVAMLRMFPDVFLYNSLLSRNINFRWSDASSALRAARPWQYLKRLFGKEHHDVLEREGASKAIFQNHTHFQLERINIHFDAHPENLKVLEMQRHPVGLVFEWRRKNRGGDLCCSPWNIAICGSQAGTAVHHLAFGWEQSYLQANPLDRIVRMLHGAQMRARETYVNLPAERREKIKLIKFEQLASNPEQVIDSVALFLNTQRTRATTRIVRKLKLPWSNINNILASQRKELDDELSENATMLLDEMIDDYHTGWSS